MAFIHGVGLHASRVIYPDVVFVLLGDMEVSITVFVIKWRRFKYQSRLLDNVDTIRYISYQIE